MAVGEPRIKAGVYFAVFAACIVGFTDEQQEKIGEKMIRCAFQGEYAEPSLAIAQPVAELAAGPWFEEAVCRVAKWQDPSVLV